MRATIRVRDLPDGQVEAIIEYEDGHTVRMEVAPDNPILWKHLGLGPATGPVPA